VATKTKSWTSGPATDAAGGFTMVELMVALVLGLFILAVLANVFLTTRQTGVLQQELSRVQEAGRFSTEFLAYDIRMAGYAGCRANLTTGVKSGSPNATCEVGTVCTIVGDQTNIPSIFNPVGLTGHSYTGSGGAAAADWTPALPTTFFKAADPMPKPFTDVFIVQRASSLGTHLTGNPTPSNGNIQIVETAELAGQLNPSGGEVLMVADCKGADVFMSTNLSASGGKKTIAHASSGNEQPLLTHSYSNDAELFKLVSRAYYVRNNPAGVPALFRRELTANNSGNPVIVDQELVEGIEFMIVSYGVDASPAPDGDGVVDRFVRAASVTDFKKVKAARVGLLARTPGTVEMSVDTTVYNLADDAGDSSFNVPTSLIADKNRRQIFTMLVQRRN